MFTVTITKTTIEEKPAGKEWQVVSGSKENKDHEWGYTPEIMKKKEVELKVYEQTVDEMDITRVISAVNGGLYEIQPKLTDEELGRELERQMQSG